ncbi:MAG: SixA phosphatase family protein [Pyrinomonadaceae bacterium]
MKRLLLVRHAKSSWDDPKLADFDRPLNERGLTAASFMGELMAGRGLEPDMIVSSPAKRAIQTATMIKESGGFEAPIRLDERIYEASPQALSQIASEFSIEDEKVMMVGHNPGFEGLILFLTGALEPMPTAALAVIDLDIEKWSELQGGCGKVVKIIRPKNEMQK